MSLFAHIFLCIVLLFKYFQLQSISIQHICPRNQIMLHYKQVGTNGLGQLLKMMFISRYIS